MGEGADELPENVDLRLLGTMILGLQRRLDGIGGRLGVIEARAETLEARLDAIADDLLVVSGMAMHGEGPKREVGPSWPH